MVVSGSRSLYQRNHCVYAGAAHQVKLSPALFPEPDPRSLCVG